MAKIYYLFYILLFLYLHFVPFTIAFNIALVLEKDPLVEFIFQKQYVNAHHTLIILVGLFCYL